LSRALNPISGLLCLTRLGGTLLIASAANAAEPYRLGDVIGKPLKAAIEEFPGGAVTYSTRPNRRCTNCMAGAVCLSFYSTLDQQKMDRRSMSNF